MSATLTTSGYDAMPEPVQAEFIAWMKANGRRDGGICTDVEA